MIPRKVQDPKLWQRQVRNNTQLVVGDVENFEFRAIVKCIVCDEAKATVGDLEETQVFHARSLQRRGQLSILA
ncbi:Uncharacterized protein DAT39_001871 [Clarias magur]|uniref:Uncharacterized protein n=1 Tax=Clarias magur TaxID=1594786 RepID=A0A8J4UJD8_CLAMG|nr:Uncharacterized protein DAT39_001871 [Clarias magur]